MSAIIYIFAIQQKGFVSTLLSNKMLVLSGEISYAFYMFHLPVIRYCDSVFVKIRAMTGYEIHEMLRFSAVFIAIFAMSLLSFYYYESPLNRKIKDIFKKYKLNLSLR